MELILQTIAVFALSTIAGALLGWAIVTGVMRFMGIKGDDYDY